jgi:carboxypeptidase PM20D1
MRVPLYLQFGVLITNNLRRLLWLLLAALVALLVLLAVLVLRANGLQSKQINVPPVSPIALDDKAIAQRLAGAVRQRTISSLEDANLNRDQFLALHAWLARVYPLTHQKLKRELVNNLSLLYTWEGVDKTAPGVLFLAHQDVVPVAPGTENNWTKPPFSGEIDPQFVWGRGAWDNKANLIAQLEAVEKLLSSGFKPKRTIYLAFGADEEVGGLRGAKQIAALLKSRQVKLDYVLDEGLLITEGILPGLNKPAAVIGVAEKGYLTVKLNVQTTPGHASMPPPKGTSAVAALSQALVALENNQLPTHIRGVARETLETLGAELDGFMPRLIFANLWLFEPLVKWQMSAKPSTNAMLRTTTALTVLQAGNKENVLPANAEARINFRILPGDSQASVLEHVHAQVKPAVSGLNYQVEAQANRTEPSKESSTQSDAYRRLNTTVRQLYPDTIVLPGLVVAGTDAKHFEDLADNVYRFSPIHAKPEDLGRFHGTNERVSVSDLLGLVRFYHLLMSAEK